jgi:hypothetical protein
MWQCRVLLDRVPDGRLEAEPQEKSPEARSRREDEEEGSCGEEQTRTGGECKARGVREGGGGGGYLSLHYKGAIV